MTEVMAHAPERSGAPPDPRAGRTSVGGDGTDDTDGTAVRVGTRTARPGRRRMRRDIWFVLPAVLVIVATVVYPLLYNLVQSLYRVGIAQIVSGGEFVGLANYTEQFRTPAFWHALAISLLYTVGTLVLTLVGGLALALFFTLPFRGRTVLRALLLMAWILPSVVSANVWRWMLDGSYGLLNALLRWLHLHEGGTFWLANAGTALPAVILASAWTFAPFAMILLTAGLQAMPSSVYEAGRIDGAGAWSRFRYLTLPLLRPVTLTTALLCFIYTFKTFDTVFLMTGGGPGSATTTLPVYAYQQAFTFYSFGKADASTTVLLLVPLVLAVLYFRSLRREDRS